MAYPCRDCDQRFTTWSEAEEHAAEEGHSIGKWRGDE